GGLYYHSLFDLFGFNPAPFRVATCVLLAFNLVLAARLFRKLTDFRITVAISTLIFSFHPTMARLYYAYGTIYDVLCVFFGLLTLGRYISIRSKGQFLDANNILIVAVFYGAALGSKEMAATIPGIMVLYEAIYHPDCRQLRKRMRPPI